MPLDFPNTPTNGQVYEKYKWNATDSVWDLNLPEYIGVYGVEYLVIAGAGSAAGGSRSDGGGSGGGGAGGYRSNISGELSGGGSGAEPIFKIISGDSYSISIGAGGTCDSSSSVGTNGSDTVFGSISSTGGGAGGKSGTDFFTGGQNGFSGGSGGGGAWRLYIGGQGTSNQGFDGGPGNQPNGGGGGGAGSVGLIVTPGNGLDSSITGSSVIRAVGGQGGQGSNVGNAIAGNANTGTGGSGIYGQSGIPGNGGSGIVILKYPNTASLSIPVGLTATTDDSTVAGYKITTFTAGTGTITVT